MWPISSLPNKIQLKFGHKCSVDKVLNMNLQISQKYNFSRGHCTMLVKYATVCTFTVPAPNEVALSLLKSWPISAKTKVTGYYTETYAEKYDQWKWIAKCKTNRTENFQVNNQQYYTNGMKINTFGRGRSKTVNIPGALIKNNPLGTINYLSYCNRFFHQIYSFYRGFRPHMAANFITILTVVKNYHYLNLKVHFSKWTSNKIVILV